MPEVMFLPLAVPEPEAFGSVDAGVLARRIPDFVHQVLNQGQHGPTGMLEVQSPPDHGPVDWVLMDAPPDAEEAFDLLPDDEPVRAVVTGELRPVGDGVRVEFHCYFVEDLDEQGSNKLGGVIALADPLAGLLPLVRRLARMLELPYHEPPRQLLTQDGRAFLLFLRGLDNAMLLSGDLEIAVPHDRAELMQPFAEALVLDPHFGLALRVAHSTMAMALADSRLQKADLQRFLDRCYALSPIDGEGCVAVAEQLSELGDEKRAIAWLRLATDQDPPPPRGLENLGILFANRGDTKAARELWQKGLELDGHPDFFAHLARLAFTEGRQRDAFGMVLRGLRQLHERAGRSGEWDEHERGAGVLLQYLHEHLDDAPAPDDLVDALLRLRDLLDAEDRVGLGLCLHDVGRRADARAELIAGLEHDELDLDVRDQAVRALLQLAINDFDRRCARAQTQALRGRNPRASLKEFQLYLELQPEFWPALFYSAIAKRRLGQADEAIDLLDEALRLRPDRPELLQQLAQLFDARGNPKRALELLDRALEHGSDVRLLAAKVTVLLHLGRRNEARAVLQTALQQRRDDRELLQLQRQLEDD